MNRDAKSGDKTEHYCLACIAVTVHSKSLENLWDVENYRHSPNVQRSNQVMVGTAF